MRYDPRQAGVSVPVDHLLHRATIAVLKQRHPGETLGHQHYDEYQQVRQRILKYWLWADGGTIHEEDPHVLRHAL